MRIIFYLFLFSCSILSQPKSADEILEKIKNKYDAVKDYEVDIKIKVDMEFLRIPKVSAKVYFKYPDKMKMDSKDFAILPKEGISFSPTKFLNNKYSAIYVRSDTLENIIVDVIKIIPLEEETSIILSTLWVDSENYIIRKVETTTKNKGSFTADLIYKDLIDYGLPSEMIFTFNIEDPEIPETLNMNTGGVKQPIDKVGSNLTGKIQVYYSNYKVNQGIEDSFFENESEAPKPSN